MTVQRIDVAGIAKLPTFCHAVQAGDFLFISGTLGTVGDSTTLIAGGVREQTTQTLRNIETVLVSRGLGFGDLVKAQVFLTDMAAFADMNAAYLEVLGDELPARITVGCSALALGALVEIECTAYLGD
jgi:2-iminobutanoate/2-iminopropanoate deaminase